MNRTGAIQFALWAVGSDDQVAIECAGQAHLDTKFEGVTALAIGDALHFGWYASCRA